MSKKKKIIILTCMFALLAVTAVFNYVYTTSLKNEDPVAGTSTTVGYFSQYRENRVTTRNEELLQIDDIINSSEEGSAEKAEALKLKLQLTEITEKELLLESLIKAYGFEDVVVIISMTSDNVNVITKSENITADDSIKIYTIVEEENIAPPENVKIIPIV